MKRISCLVAVAVTMYLASKAHAWTKVEPLFFSGYTNSTPVVRIPEKAGGMIGFIAGGIVTVPIHMITGHFGDPGHHVFYACEGGRETGQLILGAPFWLLEGVCWRWPKALFTRKKPEIPNEKMTATSQ